MNILKDFYKSDLYNSRDLIEIFNGTDKEIDKESLEKDYDSFYWVVVLHVLISC